MHPTLLGVVAIVLGAVVAGVAAARRVVASRGGHLLPVTAGAGPLDLLGLELLVAADIIRTVATTPTLGSVTVLALIVLIRTFLSWSLEL